MYKLRPICSNDEDIIFKWRNQDRIRDISLDNKPLNRGVHSKWFKSQLCSSKESLNVSLIFESDGVPLGLMHYSLENDEHRAEWGFYLGESVDDPRAGLVFEYIAIEYIFQKHQRTQKIYGKVLSNNKRVLKLHLFFGFKQEGQLKKHIKRGDHFLDVYLISMFRLDWEFDSNRVKTILFGK